jgi:hypothetical protein
MTLVQQRIFGGFSLKLKNKSGAQNSIKERGMRGKGDRVVRYCCAAGFGLD